MYDLLDLIVCLTPFPNLNNHFESDVRNSVPNDKSNRNGNKCLSIGCGRDCTSCYRHLLLCVWLALKQSLLFQAMETVDDSLDYIRLAALTDGFSGSDIREICRTAAVFRMRDLMASLHEEDSAKELRPLTNEDMLKALAKLRESRLHCGISQKYVSSDLD